MQEETICPACGENILVECDSDDGQKASWGYNGGTEYIPASFVICDDTCEECGHTFTSKERDLMTESILNHLSSGY